MVSTTLFVKNMVCNRCIKVVKEELEKTGLQVEKIKLGEVQINSNNQPDLKQIKAILEENGFELLEDKNIKLTEAIKTLIIKLIHHSEQHELKENYSDIISREIGKDYHFLSNLFSGIEHITIEKYIILQKIEKVKELLIYNEYTLSEIAYRMHYSSAAHLSAQFRQITGLSPTEFRKQNHHDRKPLDSIGN
jgi:AraC family transcriptional regulator